MTDTKKQRSNRIPDAKFFLGNLLSSIASAGTSVRRVCQQAGVNPAVVSHWKAGRVEPKLSSLQRLERALVELNKARA